MMMRKLAIAAFVGGCFFPVHANEPSSGVVGAWASGEIVEACQTGAITHFMSDGVVAVFMTKDGDLHSLGSWSATETELRMTHNDFPLEGDGLSKPPVSLEIVALDDTRFVTRNSEGIERARVRCPDVKITMGHDGHSH